jgi:hypothetical protein
MFSALPLRADIIEVTFVPFRKSRIADRSRVVATSSGFFFSENSKTLRVNQDYRSALL